MRYIVRQDPVKKERIPKLPVWFLRSFIDFFRADFWETADALVWQFRYPFFFNGIMPDDVPHWGEIIQHRL